MRHLKLLHWKNMYGLCWQNTNPTMVPSCANADATKNKRTKDLDFVRQILMARQDFQQLINLHQEQISLKVSRYTSQGIDHTELVSEVFFQVFVSLKKFKGNSSLGTWVDTIATRVCHRFLKQKYRQKRQNELLGSMIFWQQNHQVSEANSTTETFSIRDQIEHSMSQLRPEYRLILTLLYWEEHSIKDAATKMNWSVSQTKVKAHRARNKLKEILERQDEK